MPQLRIRRTLYLPLTLSAMLMALNIALMVCWIVLLAQHSRWTALTIGTVAFAFILLGLTSYLFLTIKERRLNQRQTNFVDSVTHELKSPIASVRLFLETLRLRQLDDDQRSEFYDTMAAELRRLDVLINQLLEVARIDAVGQDAEAEDIALEPLLRSCAEAVCTRQGCCVGDVFEFDVQPAVVVASRMVLEMIFGNLLDNAVKYGGRPPRVEVRVRVNEAGRVVALVADNGPGVPREIRKRIFARFFRGGDELHRQRQGTGLGLYIAHTLVRKLKGRLSVRGRDTRPGSFFEVELRGRAESCVS